MSVNEKMTAIADAIRAKTGGTETLTLDQMAKEIAGIEAGGGIADSEAMAVLKWVLGDATGGRTLPDGITAIRDYAFYNAFGLALTELPASVKRIGTYAFYKCNNVALTTLPSGLEAFGTFAFSDTAVKITEIPDKVTALPSSTFIRCKSIEEITIPIGITYIETDCFFGCTNLQKVTIKGTPTFIRNCFAACKNLKDIYVPWSEGAVSGAPWGATTATIHYDYTGG